MTGAEIVLKADALKLLQKLVDSQAEARLTQLLNTVYSETIRVPARQAALHELIRIWRSRGDKVISLQEVKLQGALLARQDFSDAYLGGADLSRADLTEANFRNALLNRAKLDNAKLRGANLCRVALNDSSLRGADLTGANLDDAVLHGADLEGADLTDARCRRGALEGAVNLTSDQKASAILQ